MKAMQIETQAPLTRNSLILRDREIPDPFPEQIRIRIHTCGVCHTDLHEVEGDLPITLFPRIPGHEIIGIVDKCGELVKTLNVGDRVGVGWLHHACGYCDSCRAGSENLCDQAFFTGYTVDGGYCEYLVILPEYAYRIPDHIDDLHAAPLMCAGIIGYRSLRVGEIHPHQTIGLYGFGASAHIILQIARAWNCATYVFTRSANHQKHARQLGASWVGSPFDSPPRALDRAISFVPNGSVIPLALKHLKKGGILAINAVSLTEIPALSWEFLYYERQIRSVANTTRQDALEFFNAIQKIPLHTEINPYWLEDANLALEDMKNSRINGAAVLQIK